MSRLGRKTIKVPESVKIELNGQTISVTGPKGSLTIQIPKEISLNEKDKELTVSASDKSIKSSTQHGTTRALVANMVKGVSDGWSKSLELVGTGFRAETSGKSLTLNV